MGAEIPPRTNIEQRKGARIWRDEWADQQVPFATAFHETYHDQKMQVVLLAGWRWFGWLASLFDKLAHGFGWLARELGWLAISFGWLAGWLGWLVGWFGQLASWARWPVDLPGGAGWARWPVDLPGWAGWRQLFGLVWLVGQLALLAGHWSAWLKRWFGWVATGWDGWLVSSAA